jgi:TonB family protein
MTRHLFVIRIYMSPKQRALLISAIFFFFCAGQAHAQVKLSPDEADKLVIEQPAPFYPPIAKAARAEGIVKVEATVSDQGIVTSAKAISGHPLLHTAAVTAVKGYKYKAHMVDGKAVPFVTLVYVSFPPKTLTGPQKQEHDQQAQIANQYFDEYDKCRDLLRGQKWDEAEKTCGAAVRLAEQMSEGRVLEKMGAYRLFGFAMLGQRRFQEALEYAQRALDVTRSSLSEKDAETAALYGDVARAHHLLKDLDKAREFYRKAEKSYQLAIANIKNEEFETQYKRALKSILEVHLLAADQAGDAAEVEEIKKLIKSLP